MTRLTRSYGTEFFWYQFLLYFRAGLWYQFSGTGLWRQFLVRVSLA